MTLEEIRKLLETKTYNESPKYTVETAKDTIYWETTIDEVDVIDFLEVFEESKMSPELLLQYMRIHGGTRFELFNALMEYSPTIDFDLSYYDAEGGYSYNSQGEVDVGSLHVYIVEAKFPSPEDLIMFKLKHGDLL